MRFNLKPRINKSNNQINISIPRRQLPPDILKQLEQRKKVRVRIW